MKKLFTLVFLLVLLVPAAYSLTAAIGNAKTVLNVEGSPEDPAIIDRTLKVINKNDIPVKIHLNPSIELRPFVTLIDNDFVIEPGEEFDAAFILRVDRGGTIQGVINVLFSPADPDIKDNEVGLISSITIISDGPIIDVPDAETDPEVEEETFEEESEIVEETEIDGEVPTEILAEETDTNTETEFEPVVTNKPVVSDGPDPLVGIGIMVVIVLVGLVAFIGVMKLVKK